MNNAVPGEVSQLVATYEARTKELDDLRSQLLSRHAIVLPKSISAKELRHTRLAAAGIGALASLLAIAFLLLVIQGTSIWGRMIAATGWLGVSAILVSTVALVLVGALAWPDQLGKGWLQLERITSSSAFYFFAGLALLLYSIHTSASVTHPSLTFLLAMLGVAVMLFGTGSQSVGSIATGGAHSSSAEAQNVGVKQFNAKLASALEAAQETHDSALLAEGAASDAQKGAALPDLRQLAEATVSRIKDAIAAPPIEQPVQSADAGSWGPFKASAAVAGGAAVLTAIFGYGVILYRDEIKDVFGVYDRYVRIRIDTCASFSDTCTVAGGTGAGNQLQAFKLEEYNYKAELLNGTPIFAVVSGNEIQMLVFDDNVKQNTPIRLSLVREKENKNLGKEVDSNLSLIIQPESFNSANGDNVGDAQECSQYSNEKYATCTLRRVVSQNRGSEISTVLYSLNMYRKENTPSEASVNGVKVTFE
jgi:hypothetical protein